MKQITFLLTGIWMLVLPEAALRAQSDSARIKILSDSLANLYERYFRLEQMAEGVETRVNSSLKNIEDKYRLVENQSRGNAEQLQRITSEDLRSDQVLYERNRLSIMATASFMDAVNISLNALEFSVSSLDYSNSIFELNNPTNTDLGFSLDKAVLRIVDEKIINGKFAKKFGDKLRGVISGILNNPIVSPIINNPITKAVFSTFSTVPAVSSISSVFNVVNSFAVSQEEINAATLRDFSKELQKYVAHYEALAKASRDLDFNLANLKLKSESVRKLSANFVRQSVTDVYTEAELAPAKDYDMNRLVKEFYNYARVSEYIRRAEAQNNNNFSVLYKRFVFPVVNRSKAAFINEEVEKLYNEYLTTLSSYHKNILAILENATGLSEAPEKIALKIADLNRRYQTLIDAYQKSVDVENLKDLEENIPRF
ncbi:MAG: hypothetical protein OHK0053_22780 [Microscillaceae bacterium]